MKKRPSSARAKGKPASPAREAAAWFSAPRVASLEAEVQRWLGTPFRADSAAPGAAGGVDCVRLIDELNAGAGPGPRFHFPRKPLDWTAHSKVSLIELWLDGAADDPRSQELARHFRRLQDGEQIRPGDLITFRIHHAAQHCGMALGPASFCHVMWHSAVTISSLEDPTFASRLSRVYRRIEP